MTRATDHVTDHNELVGLLLTEATRFGYTPVSNGPFTYDDPGHIDEHNLFVDDLKALATIAGRTFTTALPDTAKHGDPGHPADHDLLRAAVTEVQAWPAWNDCTGGTVATVDNYNGTGERWRVHTFTGTGTLDISLAVQPFEVLLVAGGGGGSGQWGNNAQSYVGGSGGSGGVIWSGNSGPVSLTPGAHSIVVGNGGVAGGSGGNSTAFSLTAIGGGAGRKGSGTSGGSGGGSAWGDPAYHGPGGGTAWQGHSGEPGAIQGGRKRGGGAGPYEASTAFTHAGRVVTITGSALTVGEFAAGQYGSGGWGHGYNTPGEPGRAGVVIVAYRIG